MPVTLYTLHHQRNQKWLHHLSTTVLAIWDQHELLRAFLYVGPQREMLRLLPIANMVGHRASAYALLFVHLCRGYISIVHSNHEL